MTLTRTTSEWQKVRPRVLANASPANIANVMDDAIRDIVRLSERVEQLERGYSHCFVPMQSNRDFCKECGMNFRDGIHKRVVP